MSQSTEINSEVNITFIELSNKTLNTNREGNSGGKIQEFKSSNIQRNVK